MVSIFFVNALSRLSQPPQIVYVAENPRITSDSFHQKKRERGVETLDEKVRESKGRAEDVAVHKGSKAKQKRKASISPKNRNGISIRTMAKTNVRARFSWFRRGQSEPQSEEALGHQHRFPKELLYLYSGVFQA